jgi:hypothetical protein
MVRVKRPRPAFSEQAYQNSIMVALCAWPGCRVWRTNAGKILARYGGAVKGAPDGAADILGLCRGIPLSLECKLQGNKPTAAQDNWTAMYARCGGLAMTLTAEYSDDLAASVEHAVALVAVAIAAWELRLDAGGLRWREETRSDG